MQELLGDVALLRGILDLLTNVANCDEPEAACCTRKSVRKSGHLARAFASTLELYKNRACII
jgi:hypothetical protein